MWWLGFVLHEAGFSLLLILLPLYVVSIGGSLIDIGIMCMMGQLVTIPASMFWGYACDRARSYKLFILLSFLSLSIATYFLIMVTKVSHLIALYVLLSIFHSAHGPPRNALIAELYTYEEWKRSFAVFEEFAEVGRLIGLLAGAYISFSGASTTSLIILCGSLHIAAFLMSIVLIRDPILILERRLIAMKRAVDLVDRGTYAFCRALNGFPSAYSLKEVDAKAFCVGLTLFQAASSMLFTPMPVFLLRELALEQGLVFTIYTLNSLGVVLGYLYLIYRSDENAEKASLLKKVVLLRSATVFLMLIALSSTFNVAIITALLTLLGYLYALFYACVLTISMELLPPKKVGLTDAIMNLGSVCGAFIGPLIADKVGFNYMFLLSGLTFFASFIAFKVFNR
ncbi:MAG: MFS transporter [Candidatus Nezhaarchaeales archaeon]